MTTPQNNFVAASLDSVTAPCAVAINQGDLVKIVAGLAVPADTPATDVVHGVARDTTPVVSLGDSLSKIIVTRSGIHFFYLSAGTASYNDKVYIGADAQHVTLTSPGAGSWVVGQVRELTPVLGGASVRIRVDINTDPALKTV